MVHGFASIFSNDHAIIDDRNFQGISTIFVDQPVRKRLGELLIERGKLDAVALERALRLQQDSGDKLGVLLVTLGLCAQRDVAEALAAQLGLPLVDAAGYPEFPILEERVSTRFLREARALPVREDDDELALAMADPTDAYAIGAFEMVTGRACGRWSRSRSSSTRRSSGSTAAASRRMGQSIGDDIEHARRRASRSTPTSSS